MTDPTRLNMHRGLDRCFSHDTECNVAYEARPPTRMLIKWGLEEDQENPSPPTGKGRMAMLVHYPPAVATMQDGQTRGQDHPVCNE